MNKLTNISSNSALVIKKVVLPDTIKRAVKEQNWNLLDEEFTKLVKPNAPFFNELKHFFPEIKEVEFIISLRSSLNEHEEDGIWHDDGSRVFAFSLGLNLGPEKIKGGKLLLRKKGEESYQELASPKYGECYFFKTGVWGYEHKICQVTQGERLIIAGWCT